MDLLTPEFGLFFWTLVAFLTVFFILKKYAWKPILNSLGEREKGIAESIASADKIKQEMGQLKAENEKIMAQAREERTQMLSEARKMSEQIVTKAKEDTKLIADKMITDAMQQIEQQKMAALTEVKNEIGSLAITVAEKILRSKLATTEDQSSYINMLSEEIKMN